MGQMVNLFTEPLIGEHGYLFSGNELGNNFCSSITDAPGGLDTFVKKLGYVDI